MVTKSIREKSETILYLLPLLIGLAVFKIWPLVQVILISFREEYHQLLNTDAGIGFGNYQAVLTDEAFLQAIGNTVTCVVFVVLVTGVLSVLLSWSLFRNTKGGWFFRTVIFLPFVCSEVAVGACWRLMFHDNGIVNQVLKMMQLPQIGWLSDKDFSLAILIVFGIWNALPMSAMLLYCSLQSLDNHLLIAAKTDRASEWKMLRFIGIPHLKTTLMLTAFINCIGAWLTFNGLFPLFSGLPGPFYNLYTLVYYIYDAASGGRNMLGVACAASVLLLSFLLIFLLIRCMYEIKKQFAPK